MSNKDDLKITLSAMSTKELQEAFAKMSAILNAERHSFGTVLRSGGGQLSMVISPDPNRLSWYEAIRLDGDDAGTRVSISDRTWTKET